MKRLKFFLTPYVFVSIGLFFVFMQLLMLRMGLSQDAFNMWIGIWLASFVLDAALYFYHVKNSNLDARYYKITLTVLRIVVCFRFFLS